MSNYLIYCDNLIQRVITSSHLAKYDDVQYIETLKRMLAIERRLSNYCSKNSVDPQADDVLDSAVGNILSINDMKLILSMIRQDVARDCSEVTSELLADVKKIIDNASAADYAVSFSAPSDFDTASLSPIIEKMRTKYGIDYKCVKMPLLD